MHPTRILVATLTGDRRKRAQAAREARAACRVPSMPWRRSRSVPAAVTGLVVLAPDGDNRANEYVRP
jgi:hypothetical protein